MHLKINEGAIFIADAHENEIRKGFWEFLCALEEGKIQTTQLFLMGDMFDLLVGEVSATHHEAKPYIEKLEKLTKNIEIYYFEGNHDFNLSSFFTNVKIFPLNFQPVLFSHEKDKFLISHGDAYGTPGYKIYTFFIRNHVVLNTLELMNKILKGRISKWLLRDLKQKKICKQIDGFKELISSKLIFYNKTNIRGIFEGHYHQNREFLYENLLYKNFSSFACDKSYFVVQFHPGIKFTQLNLRGKNGKHV